MLPDILHALKNNHWYTTAYDFSYRMCSNQRLCYMTGYPRIHILYYILYN